MDHADCVDLYQTAVLAKVGLQAARMPSHALKAIHYKLTAWAAKRFNAIGLTDRNVANIFESIGEQISQEEALAIFNQ